MAASYPSNCSVKWLSSRFRPRKWNLDQGIRCTRSLSNSLNWSDEDLWYYTVIGRGVFLFYEMLCFDMPGRLWRDLHAYLLVWTSILPVHLRVVVADRAKYPTSALFLLNCIIMRLWGLSASNKFVRLFGLLHARGLKKSFDGQIYNLFVGLEQLAIRFLFRLLMAGIILLCNQLNRRKLKVHGRYCYQPAWKSSQHFKMDCSRYHIRVCRVFIWLLYRPFGIFSRFCSFAMQITYLNTWLIKNYPYDWKIITSWWSDLFNSKQENRPVRAEIGPGVVDSRTKVFDQG